MYVSCFMISDKSCIAAEAVMIVNLCDATFIIVRSDAEVNR